jgi:hypothetical protein
MNSYKQPPLPMAFQQNKEVSTWFTIVLKPADPIEDLPPGASSAEVIEKINELLASLRSKGVIRE